MFLYRQANSQGGQALQEGAVDQLVTGRYMALGVQRGNATSQLRLSTTIHQDDANTHPLIAVLLLQQQRQPLQKDNQTRCPIQTHDVLAPQNHPTGS